MQLNQIARDFSHDPQIAYRKCPICAERMSHINFGGRSGVIIDRCGTHGVWLEGSELRRLTEWWRAGGKLIYQQNETERLRFIVPPPPPKRKQSPLVSTESPRPDTLLDAGNSLIDGAVIVEVIGGLLSMLVD